MQTYIGNDNYGNPKQQYLTQLAGMSDSELGIECYSMIYHSARCDNNPRADVGMGEFRRQIEYKSAWNGRQVVVVDRWFPSSKTCSDCGSYQQKIPLSVREWACPDCGARHDRDVNAAKNILKFSTVGNTGFQARGAGQNLLGHVSSTCDEARTDAGKFTEAVRLERAA